MTGMHVCAKLIWDSCLCCDKPNFSPVGLTSVNEMLEGLEILETLVIGRGLCT